MFFLQKAQELEAPLYFAEDEYEVVPVKSEDSSTFTIRKGALSYSLQIDLLGNYQRLNLPGILKTLDVLNGSGFGISQSHVTKGLFQISKLTGLKGRWQILSENPKIICDTGHNKDGIKMLIEQIQQTPHDRLFVVLGMVNDKDVNQVLNLLPKEATYFFCEAKIPRAMEADKLCSLATQHGLSGAVVKDVNAAIEMAKKNAGPNDLIFIGGSTFVVAEIKEL